MSPEVAHRVITLFVDFMPPALVNHDLTPHELRLLKFLAEGYTYKTAARDRSWRYNCRRLGGPFHRPNDSLENTASTACDLYKCSPLDR